MGPRFDNTALPTNSAVRGKIWSFAGNHYSEATKLNRGQGYWIFSVGTYLFNLDAR